MSMRMQEKWFLALAVVLLGLAAIPAAGQECARMTDGHRSLSLLFEAAPEGPSCREPSPSSLAEVKPGDEEPVPSEKICNCDKDEDCKAICGDKGGYCGIYLACPIPPYKGIGSCFCKQ